MSVTDHKKNYDNEFRESAVKLAIEGEESIAETARRLGINENTLYNWVNRYSKKVEVTKTRTSEHLYDELKQLRRDLARVTQERDLLKKAAAYFARETGQGTRG